MIIYHKFCGNKYIFLVFYVDDILFASNNIGLLHEIKRFLTKNFEMKDLSDTSFVLGIQIFGIFLDYHQKTILTKFLKNMTCKIINQVTLL